MTRLMLFGMEVLFCLGASLVLIRILKPMLRNILSETCGTRERAEFWVIFTQIMLVISPLLIVVYFAPSEMPNSINLVRELQQALFRTLLGDFIALTVIGQVIWRSIRSFNTQPLTANELE